MADTTRSLHERRLESLKQERSRFEPLWSDTDKLVCPGRYRPNEDFWKTRKGALSEIYDEQNFLAFRTFRSGMQSGQSSPSRPWFRITVDDPDLREYETVKENLFQRELRMRHVLQASNIYNVLHHGYGDLGQFGQPCFIVVGDDDGIIRAMPFVHGQFWIAQNHRYRVDTMYRICPMTVEQMVGRFVYRGNPRNDPDWSLVSTAVKTCWDNSNKDDVVTCYHAIEPRFNRQAGKIDKRNKPFTSNYWESGNDTDKLLEESGFGYNPIIAPRWETVATDTYAQNHPGEWSMPSMRMLNKEQVWKAKGIERSVDPPLQGPVSLQNKKVSLLPGKLTYVDAVGNGATAPIRPLIEVSSNLQHLGMEIKDTQNRLDRIWYADVFQAITRMEGIQPKNVYELTARKDEQMLELGPVVERQQYEGLNPIIEITHHIMEERKMFPPSPSELKGNPMRIDHVSVLAQAQKAVATGSIERLSAYVGNLAGVNPTVLDKLDLDQSVDEYADAVGAPPKIVRSDDKVEELRRGRAEQEAAAQQAEQLATVAPAAAQGAQAAKLLAETGQITGDSAMPGSGEILSRLGIAG